ncbi:MAG: DUF413 domain-containing protein [Gammaproteobacteria bacterium]|nr:DUF413 domain-containing protein [Gammaproteobacteria bacterium]
MEQNSFVSNVKFYDDINFPYGLNRSGEFTNDEAELLKNCGHVIHKLVNKELRPENEEQEHFLSVISGETKPLYKIEKAFIKYLNAINKKTIHIGSSNRPDNNNNDTDDDGDGFFES